MTHAACAVVAADASRAMERCGCQPGRGSGSRYRTDRRGRRQRASPPWSSRWASSSSWGAEGGRRRSGQRTSRTTCRPATSSQRSARSRSSISTMTSRSRLSPLALAASTAVVERFDAELGRFDPCGTGRAPSRSTRHRVADRALQDKRALGGRGRRSPGDAVARSRPIHVAPGGTQCRYDRRCRGRDGHGGHAGRSRNVGSVRARAGGDGASRHRGRRDRRSRRHYMQRRPPADCSMRRRQEAQAPRSADSADAAATAPPAMPNLRSAKTNATPDRSRIRQTPRQ